MLGLILIYFIGKQFYKLAEEFKKSKWGFAILGVVSYYAGTFIAGMAIGIYYELWGTGSIDNLSDIELSLLALPMGLLTTVGLYFFLRWYWRKNQPIIVDKIDDIGKPEAIEAPEETPNYR